MTSQTAEKVHSVPLNDEPVPLNRFYPFGMLDKLCLACENKEMDFSFAPVWQLRIRGEFDTSVARRTISAIIGRYPVLISHAVDMKGKQPAARSLKIAYQPDTAAGVDDIFSVVDLRGAPVEEQQRFQKEVFNHDIFLETDYPVRFIWTPTSTNEGTLYVQQHHGIADGKAFLEMLEDFCEEYNRADKGLPANIDSEVPRLDESEVAVPNFWLRVWYTLLGFCIVFGQTLAGLITRPGQLHNNLSHDYSGNNLVTHVYFDSDFLRRLQVVGKASGYSVNDLLATSLSLALHRWSSSLGTAPKKFAVLIPADSRPRGWKGKSFANHLASFVIWARSTLMSQPANLLTSFRRQTRDILRRRVAIKIFLAQKAIQTLISPHTMRKALFNTKQGTIGLSFSNLIPLFSRGPQPQLRTDKWQCERLEIMTPCGYLAGTNVTVIRYRDQICFNFNYKDSCVSTAQVEELIDQYRRALEDVLAAATPP